MISTKVRLRRPKSNVEYNGMIKGVEPKHGLRSIITQKYFNEITQREVCHRPAPILDYSDIILYDFKYYSIKNIKSDYGHLWEKVALALTLLYEEGLSKGFSINDWPYLYWDYTKLKVILGEGYLGILDKLEYDNFISSQEKRSTLNPERKWNYFKLNLQFFQTEDAIISTKMLINPVYERTILTYFKRIKLDQTRLENYISETLSATSIDIDNTKKINIISQLVVAKKAKDAYILENPFESGDKVAKVKRNLKDSNYYINYERLLIRTINRVNVSLEKSNDISKSKHGVRKSKYGDRISHMCSNIPRELRSSLRIQGEKITEVDIITSQPSFLLSMIEDWFYKSDFGTKNNIVYPESFIKSYNLAQLDMDGVDFYEKMILNFDANVGEINFSRDQIKLLFMKVVFGDLYFESIRGFNREGLIIGLFGHEFYNFLQSVNKLNVEGIDKSESYKNLSALLQRKEAAFLEEVMDELMLKDIMFLPLYDSLMVKESEYWQVIMTYYKIIDKNNLNEFIRIK
jgi:hypothetical protein